MGKRALAAALLIGFGLVGASSAQQPPSGAAAIKRTILQRTDAPDGKTEVVLGVAEIAADAMVGRHSHPGAVMAQVVEGEFRLVLDGQPEKVYKAGESFTIPGGAIHNEGATHAGAKVTAVYVVEKGKPLATPAP